MKIDNNYALIFDLDDTLYKEIDFLKSAYKKISQKVDSINSNTLFIEMMSKYNNDEDVLGYISEKYKISLKDLLEIYRYHIPDIKINKDSKNTLKRIKEMNLKTAILTDGRSITQRNKITALEINQYFDEIIISEEIKSEKPNLKGFQLIMDKFQVNNYCYIGDNLLKDFIAPNELGWTSFKIKDDGRNIHKNDFLNIEDFKKPSFTINRLKDLNNYL